MPKLQMINLQLFFWSSCVCVCLCVFSFGSKLLLTRMFSRDILSVEYNADVLTFVGGKKHRKRMWFVGNKENSDAIRVIFQAVSR